MVVDRRLRVAGCGGGSGGGGTPSTNEVTSVGKYTMDREENDHKYY